MTSEKLDSAKSDFLGEFIGTFILTFFGCGSVAVSVIFSAHVGLFQIAGIWGIAVTLAIYSSRHISNAHLNPAVTIAMIVSKRMKFNKLWIYLFAQIAGAFFAAVVLLGLFNASIETFEAAKEIVRGTPESFTTAKIFGEFYNNPVTLEGISTLNAFFAEFVGTFALLFFILSLTNSCNAGRPDDEMAPLFIGLSVMLIICIIAPLTQAGLNPARDLAPRVLAYIAGWKSAALPDAHWGFLTVYVLAPILGGTAAGILYHNTVEPVLLKKCGCKLEDMQI